MDSLEPSSESLIDLNADADMTAMFRVYVPQSAINKSRTIPTIQSIRKEKKTRHKSPLINLYSMLVYNPISFVMRCTFSFTSTTFRSRLKTSNNNTTGRSV